MGLGVARDPGAALVTAVLTGYVQRPPGPRPHSGVVVELSSSSDAPTRRSDAGAGGAQLELGARGFRALGVITYFLLVFGATVRVHGAGLSCPDWPLCFGEVVPQLNFEIFLEWGHRVLAGSVSLGFLALGVWIFRHPERRRRAGRWWFGALAVLMTQVVLGGLTVLKALAFWSVTLHLLTGNLFLLALLTVATSLHPVALPASTGTRRWAWAVAGMWYVQMALGGLVSSNFAGLACTEWPTCNGGVWFPTWSGIVGLQLIHRFGAYTLFALAAGFAWSARSGGASRWAAAAFGLVCLQVVLGISNVLLAMPVEIAVLHSAVGDLIGVCAVSAVLGLHAPSIARTAS